MAHATGPDVLCQLCDAFEKLHANPPPDIAVAFFDLWAGVVDAFTGINGQPSVVIVETPPAPRDAHDERRIGAYLAGWAIFKVLKHAESQATEQHL